MAALDAPRRTHSFARRALPSASPWGRSRGALLSGRCSVLLSLAFLLATGVACHDASDPVHERADAAADAAVDGASSVEPEPISVAGPRPAPPDEPTTTRGDAAVAPAPGASDAGPARDAAARPRDVLDAATEPADSAAGAMDGGSDAGADAASASPCPELPEFVEPTALSQTGLYADIDTGELAPGVREYAPKYALWTDGAVKRRFVWLPPCTQIDSSDVDFWTYPTGTKLWKQFSREDEAGRLVRVETRLIQKTTKTKWFMTAFIWNDEQSDALADPLDDEATFVLAENAKGTQHDVPGRAACNVCHGGMWDKVLGFSALQLNHEAEPGFLTLDELVAQELLTVAPSTSLSVPGTAEQADALGYLHANCGHCHNPNSKQANLGMEFWLRAETLGSNEATNTFTSNVGLETQSSQKPVTEPALRVVPGDPEQSAVYWRMVQPPEFPEMPGGGVHMPLIGTEITDELGVQLVEEWILSLE